MNTYDWYAQLIKPAWAPPAWLFGPVWTVLYVIIAVSFARVFIMVWKKEAPALMAAPFILNLIFNFSFTPLQFWLKNNLLASVDVLLVLITLVWAIAAIYPRSRWIAYAQIPYLAWVILAAALQLTITYLNF